MAHILPICRLQALLSGCALLANRRPGGGELPVAITQGIDGFGWRDTGFRDIGFIGFRDMGFRDIGYRV